VSANEPSGPQASDLTDGLVAYYQFDGNANDSSSNSLDGVVSGGALTTDRFGRKDSAYYFDGIDDIITVVDDSGVLNFGVSDFSLTAWVQTESKESHRYVVAKYKQNEFFGYGLGVTFQVPFAFIADTDSELAFIQPIASALPENSVVGKEWHLLSVTYDRSGPQRVYLDRRLVVASDIRAESGAVENLHPLTIGAQSGGFHFEGRIDDVRVYNRELSAEEVALLYDLEKIDTAKASNTNLTNALVAHYTFDGDADDQSGNGNSGLLDGGTFGVDRTEEANSAAYFDGVDDIFVTPSFEFQSIAMWVNIPTDPEHISVADHAYLYDGRGSDGAPGFSEGGYIHNGGANPGWSRVIVNEAEVEANWENIPKDRWVFVYLESPRKVLAASKFMARFSLIQYLQGAIDDVRIYDRPLSTAEVQALHALESPLPPIEEWITDGLVAHYPFNGDANDESGNGNDATLKGAAEISSRGRLELDGPNEGLIFPAPVDSPVVSFSLSYKPIFHYEEEEAWMSLLARRGGGVHQLLLDRNSMTFGTWNSILESSTERGDSYYAAGGFRWGEWLHFVVVIGDSYVLYANGAEVYSIDSYTDNAVFPVEGISDFAGSQTAQGYIDDVRIFDRALSSAEVAWLYEHDVAPTTEDVITITDLDLDMVSIPAGTFVMGSPDDEVDRFGDEGPQTEVTLTQDFWIGKTEVTQLQWEAIMGNNPSLSKGDQLPVESVSWHDAMEFCSKLTERERAAGRLPAGHEYTLPTEAQWEYACRAGTTTRFSYGDDPGYNHLGSYAWYFGNSVGLSHNTGGKLPNPWGLKDMHGGLWEWCLDWYSPGYSGGSAGDPRGSSSGSQRILRGGSRTANGRDCRSAQRGKYRPGIRRDIDGFRVALAPKVPGPTTIELQPLDQAVTIGDSITFSVVAKNESSAVKLGYQWFRNEETIEGATDALLSLENVSIADAGTYHVMVSGGFEPVSSDPFLLEVVKLSQSIQWNVVSETVLGDSAIHVQTEASSGLPVTVELVEGSAILVLEALKPLEGGTITLRATQAGNETYDPAPEVFHSIEASLRPEIAPSDGGNVIRVPALDVFTLNQELSLRAVPEDGFAFEGWQGDFSSTENPLTLTVTGNVSVLATFKPLWPLFLEQVEGGRILTNPEQSEFIEGSIVSVLGIPDEGYRFDRWLGSLSGNQSAGTLIIDEAKSVSAVFVEHRAPEIASELSVDRIKVGDDFAIESVVTGTAPLSFQWLKNGASLPGATSATLSISAAQPDDSGIYTLFVSNNAGEVRKDLVDLGVLQPLVLVNQPSEVVQMAQSLAVLEVETSGDGPLAYEWSKDGESLGFSPVSALTFESLSESDAGLYSVEITSPVSMVTSEPITLTVTPFVEAPVVTKELEPQAVAIGSSLFLTVANSGQPPFTYTWSKDGVETVSTEDPFLLLPNAQSDQGGLYSLAISNPGGEATSGPVEIRILPRAVITSQPEGVQIMQTRPYTLSVTVEGGGELSYQWFKDGEEVVDATSNVYSVPEADFGQTGLYKVVIESELGPIESDIVSVLVTPLIFAPEIIAGPRSQKVDLGESVSLTVVVGGSEPFEFTWFHEGNVIDGENGPFLIIDAVAEGDLGNYTVEVKNGQGSVLFSDGALLSLRQPVVITSEPDDQRVVKGDSLALTFEIEGDPPFTIHWEKDGEIVADATEAMFEIASVSELDAGAYQLVITERGKEIRSRSIEVEILVPPTIVSQPVDLELVEGQDIEIVVQASGTQPMTFRLLKGDETVQENEIGVFTLSNVGPVLSGQYVIEVENEAGIASTDPFNLVLTTAPPVIVSQSTSIQATPGESLEISVNATGGGISYRWFKDGALLDGETGPQLIVDSATTETVGEYFAVLTNSRGAITSDPITVSLSSRLRIERSDGLLTIEIIGGSGGEVWNIERSSNLVDWELVEKVVLEMNDGFASGVLTGIALNGGSSFFRAAR
jgi:formylglycine-generating enzyme required for sulfatase activity